jgi:hypothetical protein
VGKDESPDSFVFVVLEAQIISELFKAGKNLLVQGQYLIQCHCVVSLRQFPHPSYRSCHQIQASHAQLLRQTFFRNDYCAWREVSLALPISDDEHIELGYGTAALSHQFLQTLQNESVQLVDRFGKPMGF